MDLILFRLSDFILVCTLWTCSSTPFETKSFEDEGQERMCELWGSWKRCKWWEGFERNKEKARLERMGHIGRPGRACSGGAVQHSQEQQPAMWRIKCEAEVQTSQAWLSLFLSVSLLCWVLQQGDCGGRAWARISALFFTSLQKLIVNFCLGKCRMPAYVRIFRPSGRTFFHRVYPA